ERRAGRRGNDELGRDDAPALRRREERIGRSVMAVLAGGNDDAEEQDEDRTRCRRAQNQPDVVGRPEITSPITGRYDGTRNGERVDADRRGEEGPKGPRRPELEDLGREQIRHGAASVSVSSKNSSSSCLAES